MEQFLHILTAPDNIPITAMVIIIAWVMYVAFKQARENDRLLDEGRFDDMVEEMRT
ncbi:MAG TPA: hypothetical protein V6D17_21095 [Candidatus Obscuribacterales bacterium]